MNLLVKEQKKKHRQKQIGTPPSKSRWNETNVNKHDTRFTQSSLCAQLITSPEQVSPGQKSFQTKIPRNNINTEASILPKIGRNRYNLKRNRCTTPGGIQNIHDGGRGLTEFHIANHKNTQAWNFRPQKYLPWHQKFPSQKKPQDLNTSIPIYSKRRTF